MWVVREGWLVVGSRRGWRMVCDGEEGVIVHPTHHHSPPPIPTNLHPLPHFLLDTAYD